MATKSKEGRRSVREVAPRRAQRYRLAAGWKAHPHFSWVLVRLPAMRCQKLGRYRGDCCILWRAGRPKWKSLIVRVARYTRALTVSLAHRRTTQVRRCSCRYHDAPCCSLDSFPRSIDFYSWNLTILLHRLSASRVQLRRPSPRGCEVETGDSAQLRGRVTRQHANSNSGRNKR